MTERRQTVSPAVAEAAERIFQSGILDEIADDAMSGRLDERDAMADAEMIAKLVLTRGLA
jgi:hypothetical protein